jgi:hypothetical protein
LLESWVSRTEKKEKKKKEKPFMMEIGFAECFQLLLYGRYTHTMGHDEFIFS